MLLLAVGFIVTYVLSVGALMCVNVAILRFGDPKFLGGAFEMYWGLWAAFYAPVVIAALIAVWHWQLSGSLRVGLAGVMLFIILVVLEVSFLLDIHWSVLLAEWALLSLVCFLLPSFWSAK